MKSLYNVAFMVNDYQTRKSHEMPDMWMESFLNVVFVGRHNQTNISLERHQTTLMNYFVLLVG